MIRDDIRAAQVAAMKAKDGPRTAALRLILSKVKDRDIELRTEGGAKDDDTMIVEVLQRMAAARNWPMPRRPRSRLSKSFCPR